MRATWLWMACLLGCQTYDFEPVRPLGVAQTVKQVEKRAQPLKPALFLVVDKSGSMAQPAQGGGTRMDAMKSAMGTFLSQDGAAAHLGMLPFPADNACAAGDVAQVDQVGVALDQGDEDDARLQQAALAVKAKIDGLVPSGGTPTGATVRGLASYPPLLDRDRDRFAVLLTDGLPNCNAELDAVVDTCTCTIGTRPCTVNGHNQCLDDTGSAAQLSLLKQKGIRTIVIGFGADVANPLGAATLAAMAQAGGFTRPCSQDTDCNAGDVCEAGGVDPCGRAASTCRQSYFQAGNATELGRVLQAIKASVTCPVCRETLAARPHDPSFISVLLDGQPLQAGAETWTYHDDVNAPTIEFLGETCERLGRSTAKDPINVEIRTVEQL